jgi:hypothetical protein
VVPNPFPQSFFRTTSARGQWKLIFPLWLTENRLSKMISMGGCVITTACGNACPENINWVLKIGKKRF